MLANEATGRSCVEREIADRVRSYVGFWVPAFAGMTIAERGARHRHSRERGSPKDSCSYQIKSPSPKGRGARSVQDETLASVGSHCPLSLRSGARSQGWGEGEAQAPIYSGKDSSSYKSCRFP